MIKVKTIQQFKQVFNSKLQNFEWETYTQADCMAKWQEIKDDLLQYYNQFRTRSKSHDSKRFEK